MVCRCVANDVFITAGGEPQSTAEARNRHKDSYHGMILFYTAIIFSLLTDCMLHVFHMFTSQINAHKRAKHNGNRTDTSFHRISSKVWAKKLNR